MFVKLLILIFNEISEIGYPKLKITWFFFIKFNVIYGLFELMSIIFEIKLEN